MRITVVPLDGRVNINGESYSGIDLSFIDPTINAIQWYSTEGEIEIKDARGRIVENREITSFDEFASVIPLWETAKAKAKVVQDLLIQSQLEIGSPPSVSI